MSGSEIAELKAQIEAEYAAALSGVSAYAAVARHEFIQRKFARIGACQERLSALVGPQEAIRLVYEATLACQDGQSIENVLSVDQGSVRGRG